MDHTCFVRGFETLRDLPANVERFANWQRAALQALFQRFAFDEFEHQKIRRARLIDGVDLRDVGMVEARQRFRFALEAPQTFLVLREFVRQHLDRDLALQPRVARAIDLPHRAGAQRTHDHIIGEGRAGTHARRSCPMRVLLPRVGTGRGT